jgi:hypothetical protein
MYSERPAEAGRFAVYWARIVEAYPIAPRSGDAPDMYVFTETVATFERLG